MGADGVAGCECGYRWMRDEQDSHMSQRYPPTPSSYSYLSILFIIFVHFSVKSGFNTVLFVDLCQQHQPLI
jgi:hypothetical protein